MEIPGFRRDIFASFLAAMWGKHKKLILAILGSVLIHVSLLIFFALVLALEPPAQANRPDKPIRLQIVREDKPAQLSAAATPPPRRHVIDAEDMEEAEPPPPDTQAQADKNTAGRSELAPTGDAAAPSQDGKKRPEFVLATHAYVAADSSAQPLPAAAPAPETAPPLPQPDSRAPQSLATPPPEPTAAPTPVPTAAPDEFAMLEPTPTPKPADFDPFVRDPMTEPPKPTPVASAAKPSQSLSEEEKTLIRGALTNRGPSSMAALATPRGRYNKQISDVIRSRWYARIRNQMDIASFGTVKIRFSVDRRGKVIEPHVVSNSGNEALASISLQAVMDAQLPPVPPEVAATSPTTDIPLDFDFSLY